MNITLAVSFGITVAFVPAAFADFELGDPAKLPPAAKTPGVTYEKEMKPLFEKSCLKCHKGETPKGKYSMESLADILKGGKGGKSVVPGNSAQSAFVHQLAGLVKEMEMPPLDKREKYPALTREQIGLVRAWIDQGAK